MKSNKAFWGAYALFVGLALSLGGLAIFLHFYNLPGAQVSFFLAFIIMSTSYPRLAKHSEILSHLMKLILQDLSEWYWSVLYTVAILIGFRCIL